MRRLRTGRTADSAAVWRRPRRSRDPPNAEPMRAAYAASPLQFQGGTWGVGFYLPRFVNLHRFTPPCAFPLDCCSGSAVPVTNTCPRTRSEIGEQIEILLRIHKIKKGPNMKRLIQSQIRALGAIGLLAALLLAFGGKASASFTGNWGCLGTTTFSFIAKGATQPQTVTESQMMRLVVGSTGSLTATILFGESGAEISL